MIKHILLGTFCLAQFSFVYAKEVPNPKTDISVASSALQQVPKTVIIKTKSSRSESTNSQTANTFISHGMPMQRSQQNQA